MNHAQWHASTRARGQYWTLLDCPFRHRRLSTRPLLLGSLGLLLACDFAYALRTRASRCPRWTLSYARSGGTQLLPRAVAIAPREIVLTAIPSAPETLRLGHLNNSATETLMTEAMSTGRPSPAMRRSRGRRPSGRDV